MNVEIRPGNKPTVVADNVSEGRVDITPISAQGMERYAEDLAFLEEDVEVMLQPTMDGNDTTRLAGPFLCNGKGVYIQKGEWTKIKRKYLGIIPDRNNGSVVVYVVSTGSAGAKNFEYAVRAGRYPLAGVRDNNPKGAKWLQQLQANPLF